MKTQLQQLRMDAGYTSARAFAEKYGLNVNTYTSYEQGISNFSIERAVWFSDIFNCSIDELIGHEQTQKKIIDEEQIITAFKNLQEPLKSSIAVCILAMAQGDHR